MDKYNSREQTLFNRLRKAGFPLGIQDYTGFLSVLTNAEEFGISDRETLKRFCRALWVKSADENIRFEAIFDRTIPALAKDTEEPAETRSIPKSRQYFAGIIGGILLAVVGIASGVMWQSGKIPVVKPSPTNLPTTGGTPKPDPVPTDAPSPLAPVIPTEEIEEPDPWPREIALLLSLSGLFVAIASAVRWYRHRRPRLFLSPDSKIIATLPDRFTTDYLPCSPRQMKQIWRYWRCLVPIGRSDELDIDATLRVIGHQGFFLDPVLLPRQVDRTQLLLLIDGEGSMFPFLGLCQQLAETARVGGRFHQVLLYYFHNCPQGYLYRDPQGVEGVPIANVFQQLQPRVAGILIISDGGAVRGNFNAGREEQTRRFLTRAWQVTRKIAWLNPLPPQRWTKTTAEAIARQVPMFEFDRSGLERAVTVLRGKER